MSAETAASEKYQVEAEEKNFDQNFPNDHFQPESQSAQKRYADLQTTVEMKETEVETEVVDGEGAAVSNTTCVESDEPIARPIATLTMTVKKRTRKVITKKVVEDVGTFVCSFCDRRFKHATSLGGHVSKTHPSSSSSYAKKQFTRFQRAAEREYLELAKWIFAETTDACAKKHRMKITAIKKELMRGQISCNVLLQKEVVARIAVIKKEEQERKEAGFLQQ